jgi:galactosyl transferase GMA12/MNN10 family
MAVLAVAVAASLAVTAYAQPAAAADPAQPPTESKSKIALLHMVNNVWFFRDLAATTLRNKRRYAARHGYEIVVHTPTETSGLLAPAQCGAPGAVARRNAAVPDSSENVACYAEDDSFKLDKRAPTFGKIKLAIAACVGRPDYWLLWTDADALVVNQKKPLLDIVDDAFDVIVASDWFMINAGVLLLRCSPWNVAFLERVYEAREYDHANALDQSALNNFFKDPEVAAHVKHVPKWLINVYTEEYIPGDFIVHFAGKLYEATPMGISAIARQFDVLSRVDDVGKISTFFSTPYMLGSFSGTCVMGTPENDPNRECKPDDPRRLKLPEPLGSFSSPNRYRQLEYRSPKFAGWKDPNDVPGRSDVHQRRAIVQ